MVKISRDTMKVSYQWLGKSSKERLSFNYTVDCNAIHTLGVILVPRVSSRLYCCSHIQYYIRKLVVSARTQQKSKPFYFSLGSYR